MHIPPQARRNRTNGCGELREPLTRAVLHRETSHGGRWPLDRPVLDSGYARERHRTRHVGVRMGRELWNSWISGHFLVANRLHQFRKKYFSLNMLNGWLSLDPFARKTQVSKARSGPPTQGLEVAALLILKGFSAQGEASTDAPILLRLGGCGPALDQAVDGEQHDCTQQ